MIDPDKQSAWALPLEGPAVPVTGHVLVAEDQLEMRRLLCERLRKDGHRVQSVDSGPRLLDRLRQFQKRGVQPDLLLTDVRMPGLSGLQAIETMRSWGFDTVVIVLTAFADAETIEQAFAQGANAVCAKPIDLDDLSELVHRCMPVRPS